MTELFNNRIFGNELKYLQEVLQSEFRSSKGSAMMRRFERSFADRFGVNYGVSFVNGTATMHAALEAKGIGPGDEVIVPPLTMSATTFAVLQANATPVFADVEKDTFQIDPKSIESRITSNTKAIITVALYGLSPDMDPIMELANRYSLTVIEDNAECFLGTYKGRLVGSIGHCSSFSFQSSKHLTSGEGGIVLTNNLHYAEEIRKVQSLGYAGVSASDGKITKETIQDPDYSRHITMGWNYRMPELCCAVALAQTENIDLLVEHRVMLQKYLKKLLMNFGIGLHLNIQDLNIRIRDMGILSQYPDVDWYDFRQRFTSFGGDGVFAAQLTYLEPMFTNLNLRRKVLSKKTWLCTRQDSVLLLNICKPVLCSSKPITGI